MLFKKSPEKFWNLIANRYAKSPIQDKAAYTEKLRKIESYLSADNSVLDIGCATGTQCGDIAGKVKHVTGIDISRKLLGIARQRMAERKLENVEFIQTSVFDERFQSGSFDVVMAFFVLHFFDDIDAVFKRIHDLLKPNGVFISETACLGEKSKILGKVTRTLSYVGLVPKINILTTTQLEQALGKNGFRLLDKTKFSSGPDAEYTLIARKI
jgi:2-polyprenyl-3-methyl-5-hydroxy-6-metoxy-1,4-benzoquinol methylase